MFTNVTDQNVPQQDAEVQAVQKERAKDEHRYTMRISRRTIDKLGVKLYDRASAVVAELVANGYDADAECVEVRLPLTTLLGNRDDDDADGEVIEVLDNGHGMDPAEADGHFLTVGQDRRANPDQGPLSRCKKRPVMGRKGIGKLAPFGICDRIEVVSSGGDQTPKGYVTSHFILDYREIIQDTEVSYHPERGPQADRKNNRLKCESWDVDLMGDGSWRCGRGS